MKEIKNELLQFTVFALNLLFVNLLYRFYTGQNKERLIGVHSARISPSVSHSVSQ